jgi:hypothetical protein
MILPNCRPAYLTPIKIQGSNNPAAVNWTNIRFTASEGTHQITEQQITGISSPIVLSVNGAWGSNSTLYYRVAPTTTPLPNPLLNIDVFGGATAFDYGVGFGSSSQGFTACLPFNSTASSFTVNNNDFVAFICWGADQLGPGIVFPTWTVTVNNESAGAATLDTFDAITNP